MIFLKVYNLSEKNLLKLSHEHPDPTNKAFPIVPIAFNWFYAQLTEWLTAHGVDSKLYFSYLELADSEFENGLLLPDHYSQFYTPRNIEAICRFIIDKQIDVILDYSHVITGDTRKYYLEIKKMKSRNQNMHDDPQLSQPYDTVKTIRVIYTPVQRRAWTQETFSVDATTTLHQLIKKSGQPSKPFGIRHARRSGTAVTRLYTRIQETYRQKRRMEVICHP